MLNYVLYITSFCVGILGLIMSLILLATKNPINFRRIDIDDLLSKIDEEGWDEQKIIAKCEKLAEWILSRNSIKSIPACTSPGLSYAQYLLSILRVYRRNGIAEKLSQHQIV